MSSCEVSSCEAASLCLDFSSPAFQWTNPWILAMGIGWTGAYSLYFLACERHQKYVGVPPAALVLNLCWEFLFSFVWVKETGIQLFGIRVWLTLDLMILFQFVRLRMLRGTFLETTWMLLLTATLFAFLVCCLVELNDYHGIYMAFGQNLLMSILFVQDLLHQEDLDHLVDPWGSCIPGVFRWIGSTAASLAFSQRVAGSLLLEFFYISIFVWDAVYVMLSIHKSYSRQASSQLSSSSSSTTKPAAKKEL